MLKPSIYCCLLFAAFFAGGCKKLVTVDEPLDSVTAEKLFNSEDQAEGAVAGIYNSLVHGPGTALSAMTGSMFSALGGGLATLTGGLSGGEFYNSSGSAESGMHALATNTLDIFNDQYSIKFWQSAYNVIYLANGVIEGVAASKPGALRDSVKNQLSAEAKFLRAFSYFYLTNFFGDVPLALTVDFNKTINIPRSSQKEVYQQILNDLRDARSLLPAHYELSPGKRVRANKWAATALLAKVHLYLGEFEAAATMASEIIDQTELFELVMPLENVFLTNSREAIFQLKQTNKDNVLRNGTSEGYYFLPAPFHEGISNINLSPELLNAFEPGDDRREAWTDSTFNISNDVSNGLTRYPAKYRVGSMNAEEGVASKEYVMVFRLAEMYLIRAEARANGANGGAPEAVKDLNVVRRRAGLTDLQASLSDAPLKAAVAKERQIELLAEWGNRWMDLKRTGQAVSVLSNMPGKQPWTGDYQLLYPIPDEELKDNPFLHQNKGY